MRREEGTDVAPRKPHVLFLSAHLPDPLAKEAGQRLAYQHLEALSRSARVTLISTATAQELVAADTKALGLCERFYLIRWTNVQRLWGVIRRLTEPIYVAARYSKEVARLIEKLRSEKTIDMVWAEYTQMVQYIDDKAKGEKWVVYCQDILGELWARRVSLADPLTRVFLSLESARLKSWESRTLARAERVFAVSDRQRDVFRVMGLTNVSTGYPRAALTSHQYREPRATSPTVAFFGALSRAENEDAVLWFAREVWPRILGRFPNARFLIVGARPSARIQRLESTVSGVTVTGWVEDPSQVIQNAWIAVAPLRLGSGIKIKVLECLAQGVAVVASPVGAEGIPADEKAGLLVAVDKEAFVRICTDLLANPTTCERFGAAAAAWYANDYSPRVLSAEQIADLVNHSASTSDP